MKVVVLILVSLVLILNVNALAVASDYLEKNRLQLLEDTSTIYSIRLQNPDSHDSIVKVTYNDNYMKAINFKEEYILPPKSSTRIEFNVTAPKYNKNNNIFDLSYTVHQLSGPGGGEGVSFLTKISKSVKLEVVKNPSKLHINYFHVVYVIALLVIIFFLLRKKK